MLTLYHFAPAVCAAKVRVVLAEKGLDWVGHIIDLGSGEQSAPAYRAINPLGVVPTLNHDGVIVTESTVICEYLDDAFTPHQLTPRSAAGRARMHWWTKREDSVHDAINTLTTAIVFRPMQLQWPAQTLADRLAAIPSLAQREKRRALLRDGVDAAAVQYALQTLRALFSDMEQALALNAWLAGAEFTLADCGLIPFVHRLENLDLAFLFDSHPGVSDWYARCRSRRGFAGVSAWLDHPLFEEMRRLGTRSRAAVEARMATLPA